MSVSPDLVAKVRSFNRFYTREIGVLRQGLHNSPFPLPEARIIYELAQKDGITASDLGRMLAMDQGYISRTVKKLERLNLISRLRSQIDSRQWHLSLTGPGRAAAAHLDTGSRQEVGELLGRLEPLGQQNLVDAMTKIRDQLERAVSSHPRFTLRTHRIGDLGWIIQRHGEIYAEEYGWDATFEALVAEIAASFIRHFDAERERCWIAEIDGQRVGSVTCVRVDNRTAKLRLLFVDPVGRGMGIGQALVEACIAFAREAGYLELVLWTQSTLIAARKTYVKLGFEIVASESNHSFGKDLVSETWRLTL